MTMCRLIVVAGLLLAAGARAQTCSVRFGEVEGRPGEVVSLPVYATYEVPLWGYFLPFQFDPGVLEVLAYRVDGTAAAGTFPGSLYLRVEGGMAACGIVPAIRDGESACSIPGGRDVCIGRLVLCVRADAPERPSKVRPVRQWGSNKATLTMQDAMSCPNLMLVEGGLVVQSPDGPRPVGDIVCRQFLDRVQLAFTLTEDYDAIEIRRDDLLVASLSGTQSAYDEAMVEVGLVVYTVTARRGTDVALPVTCELIVTAPAAPGVEGLACGDSRLSWENPVPFDRITVMRDDQTLAELPGTAGEFVDSDPPDMAAVYAVVSRLGGFDSPSVRCLVNGIWGLEVGDVQASPGAATVTVPVYATTAAPVQALGLFLRLDQSLFTLVEDGAAAISDTVLYQEPDFLSLNVHNIYHLPGLAVVFDMSPSWEEEPLKYLQPGLRQHIASFTFEVTGMPREGDETVVAFDDEGTCLTTRGSNARLAFKMVGRVRFGASTTAQVENLSAGVVPAQRRGGGGQNVELAWRNKGVYDAIRVERNGTELAVLPGTATRYRDEDVPRAVFTYKVMAVTGEATSFPADAFVSTMARAGTFLRGDANRDDHVNVADAVFSLVYLFTGKATPRCEDAMDANDDGALTVTDAIFILAYLFGEHVLVRSPGTRYPWFDPTDDRLTCAE